MFCTAMVHCNMPSGLFVVQHQRWACLKQPFARPVTITFHAPPQINAAALCRALQPSSKSHPAATSDLPSSPPPPQKASSNTGSCFPIR